jgi:hypothetical protein
MKPFPATARAGSTLALLALSGCYYVGARYYPYGYYYPAVPTDATQRTVLAQGWLGERRRRPEHPTRVAGGSRVCLFGAYVRRARLLPCVLCPLPMVWLAGLVWAVGVVQLRLRGRRSWALGRSWPLNRRASAIALPNRLAGITFYDEFELLVQTAQAVLAMAGRNEFGASLALLEQAANMILQQFQWRDVAVYGESVARTSDHCVCLVTSTLRPAEPARTGDCNSSCASRMLPGYVRFAQKRPTWLHIHLRCARQPTPRVRVLRRL